MYKIRVRERKRQIIHQEEVDSRALRVVCQSHKNIHWPIIHLQQVPVQNRLETIYSTHSLTQTMYNSIAQTIRHTWTSHQLGQFTWIKLESVGSIGSDRLDRSVRRVSKTLLQSNVAVVQGEWLRVATLDLGHVVCQCL